MQTDAQFDPTIAWEKDQKTIASRLQPAAIADFICNRAPWARSQQFKKYLIQEAGLKPGMSLLDAGCATGQLGFSAAIYGGAQVCLLDYSHEAIKFSQAVAVELENRKFDLNIRFVQNNLEKLQIDELFNIVANQGVLEHWFKFDDRLHILKEMMRATVSGGVVIIWVPNNHNPIYRQWIKKNTEVPEIAFYIKELEMLFGAAGFKNIRVFPVTAYKTFIHYTTLPQRKLISGALWVFEQILPKWVKKGYLRRYGYELIAVGVKP